MKSAIAHRKSVVAVPYTDEVRILRQSSASKPEGTDPPFVAVATFNTRFSSIDSYAME